MAAVSLPIASMTQHTVLRIVQVPQQVFVTDKLPKTATGKIQRRHMVTAFIKKDGQQNSTPSAGQEKQGEESKGTGKAPSSSPQPHSKL